MPNFQDGDQYMLDDAIGSHFFGSITDQQLDDFFKSFGVSGIGDDVEFDPLTGELVKKNGVAIESATYSQTGTTGTITHDGDVTVVAGDKVFMQHIVSGDIEPGELFVTSVTSSTVFTVTQTYSASQSYAITFFIDREKSSTYSQSANTITVTHNGTETLEVGDVIDLNITSGSGTTENVTVTSVTSSTEFKVASSTSVSTSGDATFTKQDTSVTGNVDGIPTTNESVLSSKQSNDLIDVLSEGEINGFPAALDAGLTRGTDKYNIASLKNVHLNGTPILKSSADINNLTEGDFNFSRKDISFEPRFGTSSQTALDTINEIESETAVGIEVTKATPVSRTIQNQIDKLRITIVFPSLQEFNTDDGSTNGTQVNLQIKITENNGVEHTAISGSEGAVIGKTNTQYFRDYIIGNLSSRNYPITATVTRVTNDSTDTNLQNKFSWSSFTEITAEKKAYVDIAHVGLRFNAESFRSIPTRTYRIRGIKVKIPHNATVRSDGSLSFSGSFDGTLKTDKEWTNDPAWVLYDVLTNTRYGASIPETSIDKFAFYSASEYNSEQIDDASENDTTEPRFSCNVNINNQKEAFELIQDLCSVMRVQAFYEAGSITISQDRPSDPVYTFNISNVTEGGFSYSNQSQKSKFTRINVGFFDMTTTAIDYETVIDETAESRYGIIRTQTIKSFATTSRGQASRMAKWLLFNQNNSSEIVNFTITAEAGVLVRPGQIISVADEVKQGVRRGGRIKTGISTTQIEVDDTASTDLVTSNTAKLSVILSDGTLQTKEISDISGATVTVSSAFSSVPQANSVWVIENTTLEPTTWRVVNVQEQENLTFSITAASHNSNKYAFVEDGTQLPPKNFTLITKRLPAPESLTASESLIVINNKAIARLSISFAAVKGAIGYYLQYKFENGNFINQQVKGTDFDIDNITNGKFVIRVSSINTINKLSERPNEIEFTSVGKTELPDDVQNVQIEPLSDQFVRLRFDKSTAIDVVHGGNVVIRSSNLTIGATFTNSINLDELSGNVTEAIVPNIVNGTYLLKFRDDGGRLSSGTATIKNVNTRPDIFPRLTVLTDREDLDSPPFQGVRDDCFFSDEVNGLVLGSTVLLDDISDFDTIADFDFIGDVDFLTGGQYFFKSTLDLGGKQPLKLRRHFVTQGFLPNDLFDTRTANVDTWTDFDGTTATEVNATLSVATTDSDPDLSVSATYTINNGSGGAGTTITITKTSHGYSVGGLVTLDFTSGTGVDGDYLIASVPDANTFTLTSATSLNTSGNCTYSAEFEPYQKFVNGTYIGRGFKFKCDLLSTDPAQSIEIDQLGYFAELDSRTETSLGNAAASTGGFIASGTSTKSVTFTDSFFTGQSGTSVAANSVLPSIGITIENAQSGDFFTLSNITGTGFDIDIKNGSSNVNRNFKYAATGFGRGS